MFSIDCEDEKYPKLLLKNKDFPKKLYAIGNIELLNNNAVAIVGSRKCSEYGWEQGKRFANELSKNGICVISGMAIGVDSSAHIGAMKNIGKTIAVLGSGFNHIYPEENKRLFNEILENDGCIITEYEPNVQANSKNFPKRNRIISGISLGVLVIEARYRSGSTITANIALKQEKKVFCIPSNIDSKLGVGTNKLIQKGARLVTNANDILKDLNMETCKVAEQNWKYQVKKVPREYKVIYETIGNMPIDINTICTKTALPIQEVSEKLTILELKEYIRALPGDMFIKV